jgi:hypothetical protein
LVEDIWWESDRSSWLLLIYFSSSCKMKTSKNYKNTRNEKKKHYVIYLWFNKYEHRFFKISVIS